MSGECVSHRCWLPSRTGSTSRTGATTTAATRSPTATSVDAVADRRHDAGALVAEHERHRHAEEVVVGVAHARRPDLDEHLARRRVVDLDVPDGEPAGAVAHDGPSRPHLSRP